MVGRCNNCVYMCIDPEEWLRDMYRGVWPAPQRANHPWFPSRMQAVSGIACRNYRPKPAPPKGDVRLIPLTEGFYAYVDAADYERLSGYTWWSASGYAARTYDRKAVEQFGGFARLNFPEEWPPERRRQVQAEYRAGRDGRQVTT
ncbi:MAG TPA: hypothetical protein VLI39_06600 [Sedimentisphaerales bacterium]|nr:hypothetical protein [Sedimentisphaerales bacterium]